MLYDPKWGKDEIFTLPRFIAWLEQQPSSGYYDYCSNDDCLIAQYLKAQGFESPKVDPISFRADGVERSEYPYIFNEIAHACTFGYALTKARRALKDTDKRSFWQVLTLQKA